MPISNTESLVDRAPYLRSIRTDHSRFVERHRLLLAINDANRLGFDATKTALVDLLKQLENVS